MLFLKGKIETLILIKIFNNITNAMFKRNNIQKLKNCCINLVYKSK